MSSILDQILKQKKIEVDALYQRINTNPECLLAKVLNRTEKKKLTISVFKQALKKPGLSIIAEIKRQSPSKGKLAAIPHPEFLAQQYYDGGAAAISVLTDQHFFGGTLTDLETVKKNVPAHCPILRKDFIIDPIQIAEAIAAGADAILLIVSALGEKTKILLDAAKLLQIDVLVEVHDAEELNLALAFGASIIGINNRNLNNFSVNHTLAAELIEKIPDSVVTVAESGIRNAADAQLFYKAGFDAVLIGEALVIAPSPQQLLREIVAIGKDDKRVN